MIPAHNEAQLLPRGLAAVRRAIARTGLTAEIVVVANRCTDATERIARDAGAIVVVDGSRNLSAIRNAGVAASRGHTIVTIDADTVMHEDALVAVRHLVRDGSFVGGGCRYVPERMSPGIMATIAVVSITMAVTGLGGAMFWCTRADFDAIGGFDESLTVAEDLDFARRLREHGRRTGRRFKNVRDAPVTVCCRKFDLYGDWHGLRPSVLRGLLAAHRGADQSFADEYFYDYNSKPVSERPRTDRPHLTLVSSERR